MTKPEDAHEAVRRREGYDSLTSGGQEESVPSLDRLVPRLPHNEGSVFAPIKLRAVTRRSHGGHPAVTRRSPVGHPSVGYPVRLDEGTHSEAMKGVGVSRQILDLARYGRAAEDPHI